MTDQRDKLIDSIVNDLCGFYNTKTQQEYIENILHTHLSDKLILDRKQVEEMIEKFKKYYYGDVIQDLTSLLPNNSEGQLN